MANNEWRSCRCGHVGHWHRGRCRVTGCPCATFTTAPAIQPGPLPGTNAFATGRRHSRGRKFSDHPTRDVSTSG